MKTIFSIFLIGLCLPVRAQLKKSTNDIALVKEIDVKKYSGKEFELSADVKSNAVPGMGIAALMVLQVGNGMNFLERTRKKADDIQNNQDWKTRTFTGRIDENATKFWLYLLTYGDGDFYLDNIQFKIKNNQQNWVNIQLVNGDFEKSTEKQPLKGLENGESILLKKNVKAGIYKDDNPKYNQVLHIHSENAQPDHKIIYGWNKKAGKFIKINGIRMYYEVYGAGEPLLLLHCNGGSINSFSAQIPEFSKKYKVIAIDTRGQGNSRDSLSKNFSYNQFANDLKVLLDSLQLKNVNVLGWSDGGNTALILASEHPEYVKKLITMGANLNASEEAVFKKTLIRTQKDIKKLKEQNKAEEAVTIRLLEMLLKEPNINPESLKNIQAKTLILAGEKDEILEKHSRLIAASIPNASLMILKGQNHFVVAENPALFNKTVLDFLNPEN